MKIRQHAAPNYDAEMLKSLPGKSTQKLFHTPLLLSSPLLLFVKDFFKLQEELMFLLLQALQFLAHLLNLKHSAGMSERALSPQYFWIKNPSLYDPTPNFFFLNCSNK